MKLTIIDFINSETISTPLSPLPPQKGGQECMCSWKNTGLGGQSIDFINSETIPTPLPPLPPQTGGQECALGRTLALEANLMLR